MSKFVEFRGKVTGVGFRKRIKSLADEHQVTGWVANSVTSSVYCFLNGDKKNVAALVADLVKLEDRFDIDELVVKKSKIIKPDKISHGFYIKDGSINIYGEILKASEAPKTIIEEIYNEEKEVRGRKYLELLDLAKNDAIDDLGLNSPLVKALIPTDDVREMHLKNDIRLGTSLISSTVIQSKVNAHLRKTIGFSLSGAFNNKMDSRRLSEWLGIKLPRIYYQGHVSGLDSVLENCDVPVIVKPVKGASSNGVYSIYPNGKILRIKDRKEVTREVFSKKVKSYAEKKSESWIVEELIEYKGNPAHDLKFYAYYGDVALVRERNTYNGKSCWYDKKGNIVDAGIYELFEGDGFPVEVVKLIAKFSKSVPLPHMRIDLLLGDNGLYFGEMTPRSGNFHKFNLEYNELLGRKFNEANAKILGDLLNGKKFSSFYEYCRNIGVTQ